MSNVPYSVYDLATGTILLHGDGPEGKIIAGPGQGVVEGGFSTRTYYVLEGEVTLKETMPLTLPESDSITADGIDSFAISGIPPGTTVRIWGAVDAGPIEVMDGFIDLTSTALGDITISLHNNPTYISMELTVHAIA